MKEILKTIVAFLLAIVARAVVHRYRPTIVMVTGSVGKTSTKGAVAAVLEIRFFVRASEKSFNSEFGVPFTILGVKNPWGNPLAWLQVVKCAVGLLLLPNHYPKMLVLEVGADRPGDLAKILRIATPHAVVVTRLPEVPVHVEAYASPEQVREEEFSPAYALPAAAPLIISADDPYTLDSAVRLPSRILTYGTSTDARVRIEECDFYLEDGKVAGMQAVVREGGEKRKIIVKGSVGVTQLLPCAAALAAAEAFGIPLEGAVKALEGYKPPPGRARLFAGVNDSIIIDDSYNASPAAVEEALATLRIFPGAKRRIAVLGDMLELGRFSVIEHERVGKLARDSSNLVASVGIRARAFTVTSGDAGTLVFEDSKAAALALPGLVKAGDVILVKGSESIRTERIVEALLANRADVSKLVRQDPEWKRKQ